MDIAALPPQNECEFYHSMDLPGVGSIIGHWDLRGRFGDYVAHTPVTGRTSLDVGAATGFLSFEAEKRGAIVTSFDADGPERYEYLPGSVGGIDVDRYRRFRNGYDFAHQHMQSKAKLVLGDIYSMSNSVPMHDIVLIGQILVHLRDPLSALQQASLLAKNTLIVTEGSFEFDAPISVFLGSKSVFYAWWHLSTALYRHWLDMLGFDVVSISREKYRCLDAVMTGDIDLWTFVAKRRP